MASVPDNSGVIHACYQVSDPGQTVPIGPGPNMRVIDPSASQSCNNSEVAFSWNSTGPQGPQGPQGPRGPQGSVGSGFTVVNPTVKVTSAPIGHVVLGTGPNALSFDLLASGFDRTITKSGKVKIKEFTITKKEDKASAKLFKACATGKHFPAVSISMRKAGGSQTEFIKIKMNEVVISSIQSSSTGGGGSKPEESLTLTFAKVSVEYKPQNP